ncbi:hypothetical protein [Flagellimonas sp.]|uniref:hypothetical protein n=1 Tax=Flagellimonas sp. TaxID=2058762 RepID=UPI003BAAB665
MKWASIFIGIVVSLVLTNCNGEKNTSKIDTSGQREFDDSKYTLYPDYPKGDCRRYGIFPDSTNNRIHPKTGVSRMESLMELSEKSKATIYFPKGFYGVNLLFHSKRNVSFTFNQAQFNLLDITDEEGTESSHIKLMGTLILYDRFGTYNSNNIEVDSLIIKSDSTKNLSNNRSRGCHIYKGTKFLKIKYLEIQDLGSGGEQYKNNHAALALDGLWNNPENITIDEVLIKSSDRHGAYVTGNNNKIHKITIEKYAQGTMDFMTGMQDSQKGEEQILSGLWINRCNDCVFDEVYVKGEEPYLLKLDEGKVDRPTFINELILDLPYKDTLILDDRSTNILVKKILNKNI